MTSDTKTVVIDAIDTIRKDLEKVDFENITDEDEKALANKLLDLSIFIIHLQRK
jgi:hypothetical protein